VSIWPTIVLVDASGVGYGSRLWPDPQRLGRISGGGNQARRANQECDLTI